ncbi:hypothetical protein [Roseibium album]|uniref:Uncharacterized protein n=1 Tax=Roseibium album TaxID=311410 RepID=A0A0M7AZ43_9HYPH|nr:hypothetical protein [Roseibium album]CTQ63457.1 hypothetical protein LA5094_06256 [Roseibium album]CTQ79490.1 hypothetical protein LA5096_06218 [Roseibium album]CTQ81044.1 hypothetical protein LA5095_06286 [Roseibium album]
MKISEVIATLLKIHGEFGDLEITGGTLSSEVLLQRISVTDTAGREIWPKALVQMTGRLDVDGVYLD